MMTQCHMCCILAGSDWLLLPVVLLWVTCSTGRMKKMNIGAGENNVSFSKHLIGFRLQIDETQGGESQLSTTQ